MSNSTPPNTPVGEQPNHAGPHEGCFAESLAEIGWTPGYIPFYRAGRRGAVPVGVAGHNDRYYRYYLFPPLVFSANPDVCLLVDRLRDTGVFVDHAALPTPRQAAEILREHGITSREMTSERARRGEPRVTLSRRGDS